MSVPTPPADFERFGDLSDTSIFNHPNLRVDTSASSSSDSPIPSTFSDVDANALATALDPQPRVRKLWERKQAIRIVRRRGRLTKDEQIARSERSMMINSPLWDTSVKKVMLLARQISGKSIEDAIMQMHFSKKVKNGQRMKEFLEHARNQAMSTMGMGLGLGNPVLSADAGYEALNPPRSHDEIQEKMDDFVAPPEGPVTVTLKDNKKLKINDPKGIYLARVWVVRGPYRKEIHFRSRHRATYLQHPSARKLFRLWTDPISLYHVCANHLFSIPGLFMILKEEVTRIRESTERQARLDKRKVWVQLPDRPITAQNQHLMW